MVVEFSKEITALLVIDPYNEFRGSVHRQPDRPNQDRERPLSSLSPESSANKKRRIWPDKFRLAC
jgi:hypothetical protein